MTLPVADEKDDFQRLKKKSLAGMGALFVRQVLVKVIFFAGNIVLARMLAPQIFGIYAIVSFVVQFFSTFGDVGIGAALIQKKGELSREELSTTFWLQQMLVWLVVGVAVLIAPLVLKVYPTLPPVGVWLIRAMAVSFLFSSLKTIPAILMERNIDFKRIAWVDITENLAFQAVAITGAFLGFEAWSFILAAITRALLGAVIIYVLSPWRPSFHYRFESVKGLVRFGLPYQGNQILSFTKDAVTPLFVGAYAGAAAVGYVNWARNFAFAPLIISESFGRVAFPAFSRLQHDKELLARTVERSIRMMTLVMFPIMASMIALGPELIHVVFTDKWMPGLYSFYFFCMSPIAIGVSLPLYCSILALGRSYILLIMSALLIIFEWSLGVTFVLMYGFVGAALTQLIIVPLFTC
ncbi:MAG TPA: oligosaccharide flippase family protein, partial [Geobacterales bacterium]|nr:oligosaccharide flippase family protein [Geobacterales bacterium]